MSRIKEDDENVQEQFLRGLALLDGQQAFSEHQEEHEAASPDEPPPVSLPGLSDLGNAERFARLHRMHARYCHKTRSWFVLNENNCWQQDHGPFVAQLAKAVVRHMYEMVKEEPDDQRRQQLASHALRTEHASRLHAMIDLAKDEAGMSIEPQAFDADPMLFNVSNGVIDLKTGTCRPRRAEDFLTKQSPAVFDATATCSEWLKFLARIFQNDKTLIEYVQQVVGYCLTALTVEQVFFLLWGSGANGKSTLLKILLELLGHFGLQVPAETFLARNQQDGRATPELVRLMGARLAVAIESDDGARLSEASLKAMTGGDRIVGRRLYQDLIEFEASHKIVFATNHKPRVRDNSHAMWRRVKLIPFNVQIPDYEQDPALAEKLVAELSGILNWALAGCLAWQRAGRLQSPEPVMAATKTYREEQDSLNDFLRERCICEPSATTKFSDLRQEYTEWAESLSERPLSGKAFGVALQERGFTPELIKNARHYRGLRIRTATDDLYEAHSTATENGGGGADVDLDT